MLKFLDPKVISLFSILGITPLTMKEASSICPHDLSDSAMFGAEGVYHQGADVIAIRGNTTLDSLLQFGTLDRNWIALHELIHWTRHPSRLNRNNQAILKIDRKRESERYATEELTAQMGMLLLVEYLGLDNFEGARKFHDRYLPGYIQGDFFKAEKDARIALRYIKDLVDDAQTQNAA